MDLVILQLNLKYQEFLEVNDNKRLYRSFKRVYEYFDLIDNRKDVQDLIDKDKKDVEGRIMIIDCEGKLAPRDKEKVVDKIKKHSLSGSYDILKRNIFTPMKAYWESPDHSSEDSTIGQALAYSNDGTVWQFLKVVWIRIRYAFSMNDVSDYMEKLHTDLVKGLLYGMEKSPEYLALKEPAELKSPEAMLSINEAKLKVSRDDFDSDKSELKIGGKVVKIKQKNDKPNSHFVLEYIFGNNEGLDAQSFYTDILNDKFQNDDKDWRSMYRACNDINSKVSKQAGVSNFLFIKSGKTGYTQINKEYL
ncbi:MAG: hypothetical protein WCG02_00950 [Candidatus Taylorbacteria bacterium]